MNYVRALWTAILILAWAAPAAAGWLILEKSEGELSSLYYQNNQVRDESGESITIMDLVKGHLILVNTEAKTYWTGPVSDMLKMRDQAMRMMQDQLKEMPPEQRAQAEKAMQEAMGPPNAPAPKVTVKNTGQSRVINGLQAHKYEIWVDGQLLEEQWLAPAIDLTKELDTKKMQKMMSVFAQASGENSYESDPAVQELWSKGYPVRTVQHLNGETLVREVVLAHKETLSDSLFAVPEGYQRVKLMEMFH
ncbi:DUF4412 domain-containing protein [Desulfoferula mesophila]|uniref:DUF4412 domain-containing protein n=1 Tax=Desulfoferula mesophila TaxID=3058419 RepID=A0AAU9EMC6_9BACT|nr:hypothetical protein FAK_14150 [Desulfoferula mesophilus]